MGRLAPDHNAPESRQDAPGRAEGIVSASLAIRCPLPMSTNNLYLVAHNRLVLTGAGRVYKEQVGWLTREAMSTPGCWPIEPPFAVSVWLYLANRRRRDVDGSHKVLVDGIFAALEVDDSLIAEMHLFKRYDKENPRADVVITEVQA